MTTKELQYYYIEECKKWVQKEEQRLNRKLKACVHTLGCQMNSRDSEKLLGILEAIGYVESEEQDADFVIYNTCTVRENANLKVYGRLGILQKMKEKNPNLIVGLCGCMMQEEQVVEKIKKSYRFVDLIFGTHNIFMLAEILHERINSKKMVVKIQKAPTEIVEELPVERKFPFKSGVKSSYVKSLFSGKLNLFRFSGVTTKLLMLLSSKKSWNIGISRVAAIKRRVFIEGLAISLSI